MGARSRAAIQLNPNHFLFEQSNYYYYRDYGGGGVHGITGFFSDLTHDTRFSIRQIRRQPGFALIAVVILGLGIGGSMAVFSVLYEAVLKPLPYPDSKRLLFIHNSFPKQQSAAAGVSGFDYAEIKSHSAVFSGAGIFFWNDLTLTGFGAARHIDVVNASASLFEVLGVKPRIGRTFTPAEDQSGAPGTAVLSENLWRSVFGSDPHVLGRVVHLNGAPYTVIGVMPRSFWFPSQDTQLWIPTGLRPGEFTIDGGRLEKWLHMVARLSPSATPQKMNAALAAIGDRLGSRFPMFYPKKEGWHFTARQMGDEQTESIRRWLYLAFAAVFCVLLIACINVSGLLLVRVAARHSEVAVRMAMGATGMRIAGQILAETCVLVFSGCLLGLLLAAWFVDLINLYGPLRRPAPLGNWTLAFAVALALISTICAGLLPAWLATRLQVDEGLKAGATRTYTARGGWRDAIAAAQVALAVTLIFTATLLSRSFLNLTRVPTGFAQNHVWTGAVTLSGETPHWGDQGWNTQFFEPLIDKLARLPGVQSASGTNAIPFGPSGVWTEALRLPSQPKTTPPPEAQIALVLPGYFETIGIPLRRGRTFTAHDRAGAPLVAVIDEALAHRYFPGEDPIGKPIGSGGAEHPARIIGVVGSVQNGALGGPLQPQVYCSELQERTEVMYLVLRTNGDVDPTAAARKTLAQLDSAVALFDVHPMEERVAASIDLRRFVAFLLNGLAVTGLLLAAVGLYGVLAHLVELRRREIGIRMALGASQPQIVRITLAHGGLVVAFGLLAGAAGAFAAGLAVKSQLFGVDLTDAPAGILALGIILVSAAVAASFPAWRAARIDPAIALHHE